MVFEATRLRDKLATKWIGPAIVVAGGAERSYVIEVKQGYEMKTHRSLLIMYTPDGLAETL